MFEFATTDFTQGNSNYFYSSTGLQIHDIVVTFTAGTYLLVTLLFKLNIICLMGLILALS